MVLGIKQFLSYLDCNGKVVENEKENDVFVGKSMEDESPVMSRARQEADFHIGSKDISCDADSKSSADLLRKIASQKNRKTVKRSMGSPLSRQTRLVDVWRKLDVLGDQTDFAFQHSLSYRNSLDSSFNVTVKDASDTSLNGGLERKSVGEGTESSRVMNESNSDNNVEFKEGMVIATSSPLCSKLLQEFTVLIKEKVPITYSCKNLPPIEPQSNSNLPKRRCLRPRYQIEKRSLEVVSYFCEKKKKKPEEPEPIDYDHVPSDAEGGDDHWMNEKPDRDGFYKVERLLAKKIDFDCRRKRETTFYYIKWVGWTHYFDSWEPLRNLGNITWVREQFDARERALECVMKKPGLRLENDRLRQLRNLDRWETEMNTKLKEAHMKQIYVYNDVNEALRPQDFEYITTNKLPKEFASYVKRSKEHFCKCSTESCGHGTDCCPALESFNFFYTTQGHLRHLYNKEEGKIVECNERCSCSARCPTRIIQRGRRHVVAIVQTEKCGWGVFALEDIPANRFVVEYVGEVLPVEEARNRKYPFYQFEIGEEGDISFVIDAKNCGNESAFINHSCQPNLVAIPIHVERMIPGYHRIGFFTVNDVKRGEELTLDYFNNPSEEENYIRDPDGIKCHCGASCCKGYFPQVMNDDGSPQKPGVSDDSPIPSPVKESSLEPPLLERIAEPSPGRITEPSPERVADPWPQRRTESERSSEGRSSSVEIIGIVERNVDV